MFPSRSRVFFWHSWLGLASGLFMLLIAWSGSIAVFNDEIGWLLTPQLRADPSLGVRPIDDAVASLRERFPGRGFDLHVQSGPRWAHTAYVQEPGRTVYVHVDPATAQVTRADAMQGYTWNVVYFIRQLHVRLLMGFWGRVFVGLFGVTLVLSIITSLWIYRGWLASIARVRRGSGRRIFHVDVHKMVGAWALLINLLFGVTGAVLGLENLYNRIRPRRTQQAVVRQPIDLRLPAGLTHGAAADALMRADLAFVPTVIVYAPKGTAAVIRGDHPGALIAKDASSYRVDLATGAILQKNDARQAPWAAYLYNTLDPLHFGYFGDKWSTMASYAIKVVWCLLGLTPGVLSITGAYMWWLRRQRVRAAARARGVSAVEEEIDALAVAPVGWRPFAAAVPFLVAGYVLQAIVWERGWGMTELLWQHWIVKPVCLLAVAFPVTLAAMALGRLVRKHTPLAHVPSLAALASVLPVGGLYLLATALFN